MSTELPILKSRIISITKPRPCVTQKLCADGQWTIPGKHYWDPVEIHIKDEKEFRDEVRSFGEFAKFHVVFECDKDTWKFFGCWVRTTNRNTWELVFDHVEKNGSGTAVMD